MAGVCTSCGHGAGRDLADARVIVYQGVRVFFILRNREFEVVVAPVLVESAGAEAAAEATADTLRYALRLHDESAMASCDDATTTAAPGGFMESWGLSANDDEGAVQ